MQTNDQILFFLKAILISYRENTGGKKINCRSTEDLFGKNISSCIVLVCCIFYMFGNCISYWTFLFFIFVPYIIFRMKKRGVGKTARWNVLPLPFRPSKDGGVRSHHQDCPLFRPSSCFSSAWVSVCQRGTNWVYTATFKLCIWYFEIAKMSFFSGIGRVRRVLDHIFCSWTCVRQLCRVVGNLNTFFQNKSTRAQFFCGKKSEIADSYRSNGENTSYAPNKALFGITLRICTIC